jgi:hypothetical protein
MTHFCLNRVAHRRQRAFCPQTEDRSGGIIPAAGGLPGSGFVSPTFLVKTRQTDGTSRALSVQMTRALGTPWSRALSCGLSSLQ